jgi:hypothetical protein
MPDRDDLFAGSSGGSSVPATTGQRGGARPGAGRPIGAFNRSNRELREYLVKLTGKDAIVEQWRLASVPIMTDRTALQKLALHFGCSRKEAAEIWLRANALVNPHAYPKLGSIELKPPGAPGDELAWGGIDFDIGGEGDGGEGIEGGGTIIDLPFEELTEEAIAQAIASEADEREGQAVPVDPGEADPDGNPAT